MSSSVSIPGFSVVQDFTVTFGILNDVDNADTLIHGVECNTSEELKRVLEFYFEQFSYDPKMYFDDPDSLYVLDNYMPAKYTFIDLSQIGILSLFVIGETVGMNEKFEITD